MHSITVKYGINSPSKQKSLSYIDMMPRIELGSALGSDQGIEFLGKVPFVTFERLVEELPSFQAQTKDSHIS